MKKIFLICPVRKDDPVIQEKIERYVKKLEEDGYKVYWPKRDTEQDDPTGGYMICWANFQTMSDAEEVHIWYDESSNGSKFDMGGLFMLKKILSWRFRIIIANLKEAEALDIKEKSFLKVMKHLTG